MTDNDDFARLVMLACHDLRTPLATVHGFAQTLARLGELEDPAPRYLEMITAASGQMADLLDELSLVEALKTCRPHELYNLASVSFVPASWRQPVLTAEFAAVGVTTILESIRLIDERIRFYQASSSEIFGTPREVPQGEQTPLSPLTPYGVAKAYGHFITGSYRRRYGLHASSGILYNHESPRRRARPARRSRAWKGT